MPSSSEGDIEDTKHIVENLYTSEIESIEELIAFNLHL